MSYLLDTNILVRLVNQGDPLRPVVAQATIELHRRGDLLQITSQNLIELRNVATRPTVVNGLGLTTAEIEDQTRLLEASFALLPETEAIYPAWKALVEGLAVVGKQVHDARLVAVCHPHGVSHLLTFNTGHFARLAGFGPGLTVVHPGRV